MADGFQEELRVGIDWSDATATTEQFVRNFDAILKLIGESAGGPTASFEAGQLIAQLQGGVKEFAAEFNAAFDSARVKAAELFAPAQRVISNIGFGGAASKVYGFDRNTETGANKQLVEAGFAAEKERQGLIARINSLLGEQSVIEDEQKSLLTQMVESRREALLFEQDFAANLAAGAGEAAELVELNAQAATLTRRRNAIMAAAVGEQSRLLLGPRPEGETYQQYINRSGSDLAPLVHEQDQAAAASSARVAGARNSLADAILAQAEINVGIADAEAVAAEAQLSAFFDDIAAQQALGVQLKAETDYRARFNAAFAAVQEEELAAKQAAINAARLETATRIATASVNAEFTAAELASKNATFSQNFKGILKGTDPLGEKSLGSSIGGGLGSTAGFLLTTAGIFGLVAQIKSAITESGKLSKEFALISTILESVGQSQAFTGIKNQILDLSSATATAADVVANVDRVLAGVFSNDQGVPDFSRAAVESKTVLETSKVTGEAVNKIEDQLTAIALSFTQNGVTPAFKEIVDYSLALEQATGTSSQEILGFTATLAPLGQELGFSVKQLEGLGAVMSQVSGRPATALAENLQRILAGLSGKLPKLTEILGGSDATKDLLGPLGQAFGSGNTPEVLKILVENFSKLNQVQLDNLALLVGGRREAGTFFSLLAKAPETLRALDEGFTTTGTELEDRFSAVTKTIGYSFDSTKIQLQNLLLAILDSGVADGIIHIVDAFGTLFSVLSKIAGAFSDFNDDLHGVPGEIVGVTFAVLALAKSLTILLAATQALALTKIGGAVLGPTITGAIEGTAGVTGGGLLAGGASSIGYGLLGIGAGAGAETIGGATALGAGIVAAPLALTAIAAYQYFAKRQDAGKAADKAQARALEELKAGKTADQIKAETPDPGLLFKAEDVLGITGGINEPVDRALKQFQQPTKTAQLKALANVSGTSEKDKNALIDQANALAKNPENNQLNVIADVLIAQAKSTNSPEVEAALRSVSTVNDLDAKGKEALAHIYDPQNTKTIDELQQAGDKGQISHAAVNTLLVAQIQAYTTVIDGLKQGGAHPDDANLVSLEQTRDKYQKELDNNVRAEITGQEEFAQKLASVFGPSSNPTADMDSAIKTITTATEALRQQLGDVTPKDLEDAYFGIVNAQIAQRKALADAATTTAEKDKILSATPEINIEARRYGADLSLRTGQGAALAARYSDITGKTIEESRADIVNLIIQYHGDMVQVADKITGAERSVGQAAINELRALANRQRGFIIFGNLIGGIIDAEANALQSQLDNSPTGANNTGDANAIAGANPDKIPAGITDSQKAADARTDAQAAANARLDVLAAQANGDAVALARIAQQRAALDARFALTEADRLKAQAEMITADFDLTKALAAAADSFRKVENAAHGQDPVVVARNALASAQSALGNAQVGTAAYFDALAGFYDAQHAYAKALEDSADAQTNLAISKANFAGDPVAAAKLKLQELLNRRSDAGPEGITGDALVNLNAQIVDQTAAVAQAQISQGESQIQTALTLGRINKAQAIAQLQALKVFATNQTEIDQIDVQIKQLTGQLGQDYKYNLPSVLGLPTLYEARRVNQTPGVGTGGTGYNDNRTITVTVVAQTNADPNQIAAAVQNVLGPPRNFGISGSRYQG